jgi:hypothetical protein
VVYQKRVLAEKSVNKYLLGLKLREGGKNMAAEKTAFSVLGLFECSSQGESNDGRHFQRDVEKT